MQFDNLLHLQELWPRIESELLDMFFEGLQQLIHKFSNNLQSLFDVLLSKLEKGVENGKAQAPDICKSWRRRVRPSAELPFTAHVQWQDHLFSQYPQ